jgi:hypothetical protein
MIRPTKGSRLLRFPFNKGVELRESLSAAAAISEPSADSEVALELALWESVKDGSHAELEAYLEQYPNGTFASLARRRLEAGTLSFASADTSTSAEAAADALDLAFWNSLKDTYRREALEAYLAHHKQPLRGTRPRAALVAERGLIWFARA